MWNPTTKGVVVAMSKPIPSTEEERTIEAQHLLGFIGDEDLASLTSWERSTVEDVKEGKAANAFRLREIRAIVKRLQDAKNKEA
jgi:hypothetical protein